MLLSSDSAFYNTIIGFTSDNKQRLALWLCITVNNELVLQSVRNLCCLSWEGTSCLMTTSGGNSEITFWWHPGVLFLLMSDQQQLRICKHLKLLYFILLLTKSADIMGQWFGSNTQWLITADIMKPAPQLPPTATGTTGISRTASCCSTGFLSRGPGSCKRLWEAFQYLQVTTALWKLDPTESSVLWLWDDRNHRNVPFSGFSTGLWTDFLTDLPSPQRHSSRWTTWRPVRPEPRRPSSSENHQIWTLTLMKVLWQTAF